MDSLHPIGGGLDAVIVSTATPTPEEAAAVRGGSCCHPCRWFSLRVQFGQIQQRSLKKGIRVGYAAWQRQMPALWPRTQLR